MAGAEGWGACVPWLGRGASVGEEGRPGSVWRELGRQGRPPWLRTAGWVGEGPQEWAGAGTTGGASPRAAGYLDSSRGALDSYSHVARPTCAGLWCLTCWLNGDSSVPGGQWSQVPCVVSLDN